jgi:hypothetical protein
MATIPNTFTQRGVGGGVLGRDPGSGLARVSSPVLPVASGLGGKSAMGESSSVCSVARGGQAQYAGESLPDRLSIVKYSVSISNLDCLDPAVMVYWNDAEAVE